MALERLDHLAAGLEVLAQQYRGRPNFRALIEVFARQFQELEDAAHQVLNERLLEALNGAEHGAEGEQLSVLERIVGQGVFLSADEAVRRAWIRSRIKLNRSSGTGNQLLELFTLVLTAPLVPTLVERFPAALELSVTGAELTANLVAPLGRILQLGKAAGVGAQMIYSTAAPAEMLRFASPIGFLSAPLAGGELILPLENISGTFPGGSGPAIRLGYGANVETYPGYDSFDGTQIVIDGYGSVANPHDAGEEVVVIQAGLGDASSPGGGGLLAGAV